VLSGPPNGYELSRKEYPFNCDGISTEMLLVKAAGASVVNTLSKKIAVDIVSNLLAGKFN
jgi:hypothetical protein